MSSKVRIYHVRAGIGQRLPRAVEKKISSALTALGGNVGWVGDKCVCFDLPSDQVAWDFARKAKELGADVEMGDLS